MLLIPPYRSYVDVVFLLSTSLPYYTVCPRQVHFAFLSPNPCLRCSSFTWNGCLDRCCGAFNYSSYPPSTPRCSIPLLVSTTNGPVHFSCTICLVVQNLFLAIHILLPDSSAQTIYPFIACIPSKTCRMLGLTVCSISSRAACMSSLHFSKHSALFVLLTSAAFPPRDRPSLPLPVMFSSGGKGTWLRAGTTTKQELGRS